MQGRSIWQERGNQMKKMRVGQLAGVLALVLAWGGAGVVARAPRAGTDPVDGGLVPGR